MMIQNHKNIESSSFMRTEIIYRDEIDKGTTK